MKKIIFVALVVLTIVQSISKSDAFIIKTIRIEKDDAAIAALAAQKTALIQSVGDVVTEKIRTIGTLVNSLVQAKVAAKQHYVNSILLAKPAVFTKTITFNAIPVTTTAVYPTTTTAGVSGVITTTAAGHPSAYKYGQRYYRA